jgi:SAM-dependent methyltransferase
MGDYTNMAGYYDVIMTSGYYDYPKIVDHLLHHRKHGRILEIGCGTGLILEELVKRQPGLDVTGIDLTDSMLVIAQKRLAGFPKVSLSRQNVAELDLNEPHQLAFSYGGVWYFVFEDGQEPFMVSHIAEEKDNHVGFEKLSSSMSLGGTLLLGIQGPHHNYERVISNGMVYSQVIETTQIGFTKHYYLDDGQHRVMDQTIRYRTYSFDEAKRMLGSYGFEYCPSDASNRLFLKFQKVA